MTELLSRPDQDERLSQSVESQIDPALLQAMYETVSPARATEHVVDPSDTSSPAEKPQEASEDTREVSRAGSSIVRAAERINGLLEKRAVNKAHGEALKEYRERDHSDYIDHLSALKDSEKATPMARVTAEMALDSEYRKADREQAIENAKKKVRGFGRSVLSRLTSTKNLVVSLPSPAKEAGINGVKRANDAMGDAVMAGLEKAEVGMDIVGKKIVDTKANMKENYQTYRAEKKEKSERKLEAKVEKWEEKFAAQKRRRAERLKRKNEAIERRDARRARWTERYATAKNMVTSAPERAGDAMMAGFEKLEKGMDKVGSAMVNGKEAASAKIERSKASLHTTRAAGQAALEAFKSTRQAHNEQNRL